MGHLFGVHGACFRDAIGGTICTALPDALYVPYGIVHADVRIFQPSCTVDVVCAVCREEGPATACADSNVCVLEPIGDMGGNWRLFIGIYP